MSEKQMLVRKAAVLGAGVMGAQIAAHLANADIETLLYELPAKEGDPNATVIKAIEGLKKLDPAPLAVPARAQYIGAANYQQHLPRLAECDLVIEAIAERMDWKVDLYRKIAPHLTPHVALVSNTSGLSVNRLAEALPQQLRARFCGVHFFNPPRYMHLVELIPAADTEGGLLDALEQFLTTRLGKGVVRAKDTPNFIANRIGVFSLLATMHHARACGLGFDTVDALTGKDLERPKSATFRTLDVVGLDTFAHVVNTMREGLSDDPWHAHFLLPDWLHGLIEQGALGQKSKRGIYQKVGKEIHVLDLGTKGYRLANTKSDDSVREILKNKDVAQRFAVLRASQHPQAQFLWAVFRDVWHYCAVQLPSIADNARDLDLAVRWGFGWKQGPFEIWQAAGWRQVAQWIGEDIAAGKALVNVPLPDWVMEQRDGVHRADGSYAPAAQSYRARSTLPVYRRQIFPDALLGERVEYGHTVFENDAVRLWHMDDGIAILSFRSKMHTIGDDVLSGTLDAIELAEEEFKGLVLWQTEPPFSVGANLLQVMQALAPPEDATITAKLAGAMQRLKYTVAGHGSLTQMMHAVTGSGAEVEQVVAKFQQVSMRLRYSCIPTVAAVNGMALGGGCEFVMHCDRVVAALESYIGLVEVGVGLLPAGGGCKEVALRAAHEAKGRDLFPSLKNYFQVVAMGTVAKSAEHARELGFLRACDPIVMNPFELLHVAKAQAIALHEAGYRVPLPPRDIPVAGRAGIANFRMLLVNMREGGYISAHDYLIGEKIARIICGGEVEAGSLVDEQWLLDLERAEFMSLLHTPLTQARIEHMLKTGKPLRN
ncbi:MAG: 3-hydroxyacyl-CoA dehydrogenase/enoyl-CoA hydratase family protein [Pseudomonadota bacterium]